MKNETRPNYARNNNVLDSDLNSFGNELRAKAERGLEQYYREEGGSSLRELRRHLEERIIWPERGRRQYHVSLAVGPHALAQFLVEASETVSVELCPLIPCFTLDP